MAENSIILGIDEVGRGPWAGPLVVGAVILRRTSLLSQEETLNQRGNAKLKAETLSRQELDAEPFSRREPGTEPFSRREPDEEPISRQKLDEEPAFWCELTDSKKLTKNRRTKLAPIILAEAPATGLGWVSSRELDQYGLSASLKLATRRAVKEILKTKVFFSEIIIDGTVNFLKNTPLEAKVTTLPKADLLIREVSAASIIAKVARDQYMINLATKYPDYGFDKHMGYGTALHKSALIKSGITPEHRKSFKPIKLLSAQKSTSGPSNNAETCIMTDAKADDPTFSMESSLVSTKNTTKIGQTAESAVAKHLEQLGHTIIKQNFKVKTAEIDLISLKNNEIFFTEVKYSKNPDSEGTPLVRIDSKKQQKMRQALETFLNLNPDFRRFNPRLSVASVTGDDYTVNDWFVLTD